MKKLLKIKTEDIKRDSFECIDCLNLSTCKYKDSVALFEKNKNIEIDCWLRKRNKSMFYTGFHKPMFIAVRVSKSSEKLIHLHRWLHALDEKYDIFFEENMYN